MNYKRFSMLPFLLGLGCVLLACGLAAPSPDGGGQPSIAAQSEPAEPEPATLEPATPESTEPVKPTLEPATPEPATLEPATPEPTKPVKPTPGPEPTPRPTKPPLPEEVRPTRTPVPTHPEGLEGCKTVAMFVDDADLAYQGWCADQFMEHISDTCRTRDTTAAQRACGERIALEYNSMLFRYGAGKCAGIGPGGDAANECVLQASEDFNNVMNGLLEAWEKVRIAADQDPEVVKARDATVSCLEAQGFKNPNRDLLLPWQRGDTPQESWDREAALSQEDKDLRERLFEPSRECGKQEGLFAAQETAWAAELRRLEEEEPEVVADLIREGLLEALEKPGLATFMTGDLLSDDAS